MPWSNESASTGVAASEIESQTAELTRREADLNKQAEELKAEKMALEAERNEMQTDAEATRTSGNADRVADFEPGECYARVIIPARYKIVATNRETRQESDSVKVIPAL